MKSKIFSMVILLSCITIIKAQEVNKADVLSRLKSSDTEERIKAIAAVIEEKMIDALPVLEAEAEKQELYLQPLYIEALKILGSVKTGEAIEQYTQKINAESSKLGIQIRQADLKKMSGAYNEIIKEQTVK